MLYKYKNPIWAGAVPIFLALFVSGEFDLYSRLIYLDKVFHLLGGVVVAWFFVLYLRKDLPLVSRFKQFLLITACVSLVGVVWEFGEYLTHIYGPTYSPWLLRYFDIGDLADTLSDLVFDLLGGLLLFVMSKRSRL